MDQSAGFGPSIQPGSELARLRDAALLLVVMGIALSVLGLIFITFSYIATLTTVVIFGVMLLLGAAVQVISAVVGRCWRGFFLHLLAGILYLVAGMIMIADPLRSAGALTLLIAAALLVGGLLRIIVSVAQRFDGWGWVLLNGVIEFALGVMIWRQWPFSGLWVIGLFVGIEMVFSGTSWIMLGMAARSATRSATPT